MERPNILWICTDQQRYDTVACLGNPAIRTPNLDRLCKEGTAFTNAYCQSTVCSPSRASFLTGKYPSQIGIVANGQASVPEGTELITKELHRIGYRCGLCGKLHLASPKNGIEDRCDDKYERFHYSHDSWYGTPDDNEYLRWLCDTGADLQRIFNTEHTSRRGYSKWITADKHQTTWCVQKAIDCIAEWELEQSEDPWLLSLNIFDPHPPFDAPQEYADRYDPCAIPEPLFKDSDIRNQERLEEAYHQSALQYHKPDAETQKKKVSYYGMVELIDEQVGRILDYLESHDLRKKTLIIFHSDHGEMLGDHGLILKGARFYEGATKVPMIFSLPGVVKEGKRYDYPVELRDLIPTLKEMTGLGAEAESLWRILTKDDHEPIRNHIICEYLDSLWPELSNKETVHHTTYATMCRDIRYKVVIYHTQQTGELYDLKEDPCEFENLWDRASHREIQTKLMMRIMDHYMNDLKPRTPIIWSF